MTPRYRSFTGCSPVVCGKRIAQDLSDTVIQDDIFGRLLTFPNVLITGHQAFFTETAMTKIAETTIANITDFEQGRSCPNQVTAQRIVSAKSSSSSQ